MVIESQAVPPQPVYLHVPPDHARHWRKYRHVYHACNRPVYFVRSEEYSPHYQAQDHEHGNGWKQRDEDRGRDSNDDHGRDRDDEHGRDHDENRDHSRDH